MENFLTEFMQSKPEVALQEGKYNMIITEFAMKAPVIKDTDTAEQVKAKTGFAICNMSLSSETLGTHGIAESLFPPNKKDRTTGKLLTDEEYKAKVTAGASNLQYFLKEITSRTEKEHRESNATVIKHAITNKTEFQIWISYGISASGQRQRNVSFYEPKGRSNSAPATRATGSTAPAVTADNAF